MCFFLFRVKAQETFWGVYPTWMLVWNAVYLLQAALLLLVGLLHKNKRQSTQGASPGSISPEALTARLWVYPLLAILFYMHALLVFVSLKPARRHPARFYPFGKKLIRSKICC
jgi:hypothetical protein